VKNVELENVLLWEFFLQSYHNLNFHKVL